MFNKANGTVAKLNEGFMPGSSNHRITTVFKFKDDAADEMIKNAAYRQAGSGYVLIPVIKEMYSVLKNGKESDILEFDSGSMLRIKGKNVSFDADESKIDEISEISDKTEENSSEKNKSHSITMHEI